MISVIHEGGVKNHTIVSHVDLSVWNFNTTPDVLSTFPKQDNQQMRETGVYGFNWLLSLIARQTGQFKFDQTPRRWRFLIIARGGSEGNWWSGSNWRGHCNWRRVNGGSLSVGHDNQGEGR